MTARKAAERLRPLLLGGLNDYIPATRTTTSSTSLKSFVGLHCEHRPASTSSNYFKQGQSNSMDAIPAGDVAPNASGTGPALGYSLKLMCFILFIFMLILNTSTCFVSLTIVMGILLNCIFNFGIKLCSKVPIFLTVDIGRLIYVKEKQWKLTNHRFS